jgi:hypothetical protein
MRSNRLSTRLQRIQLSEILKYGRETITNRRKDLFLIGLLFLVIPDLAQLLAWQEASSKTDKALAALASRPPLEQIEELASLVTSILALPMLTVLILKAVGVLMLARTSVDYFESRPSPFSSIIGRSMRVLITKGFGVLAFLLIVLPLTSLIPFLFVITISLLVMLPVTLVSSQHGGLKTSMDTLFINYSTTAKGGKSAVFMTILPITGFFLTLMLGVSFLLDQIHMLDVIIERPAGFLTYTTTIFGYTMNMANFITHLVSIIWQASALVIIIPFTAAIYHLSTIPEGHKEFVTTV